MTWKAYYLLATGDILRTFEVSGPDPAMPDGAGVIDLPDGVPNGGTHKVDVTVDPPVLVALPPPEPVPDFLAQLTAAFINAGQISADSFHPLTLDAINKELVRGNLSASQIAIPADKVVTAKVG